MEAAKWTSHPPTPTSGEEIKTLIQKGNKDSGAVLTLCPAVTVASRVTPTCGNPLSIILPKNIRAGGRRCGEDKKNSHQKQAETRSPYSAALNQTTGCLSSVKVKTHTHKERESEKKRKEKKKT